MLVHIEKVADTTVLTIIVVLVVAIMVVVIVIHIDQYGKLNKIWRLK